MNCELDDFFYKTDVEGKVVWLMRFKDREDYVPILFCPFCGEPLMKKKENEAAIRD